MPNVAYNGETGFTLQPGGGIQYSPDGRATLTRIYRGPIHNLPAFRNSGFPASVQVAGSEGVLKLSAPPNEAYEGAYARVIVVYGGASSEVNANFPNDIDDDEPTVPTVTLNFDFQVTSSVINVIDGNLWGTFRLDYRTPINTVSYTQSSKPSNVQARSRSEIASEADPKLVGAQGIDDGSITILANNGVDPDQSYVKLMQTKFAPTGSDPMWKIKDAAIAFRRSSNGQFWRCSETWTKLIVQDGNDEEFEG